MTPEEKAAAAKASAVAVREVCNTVEQMSQVQRSKVRRSLGRAVPGANAVLDSIDLSHAAVFATIRGATPVVGSVAAEISRRTGNSDAPSLSQTSKGAKSVAGLGAALGDALDASPETRALTTGMTYRHHGRVVTAPTDDYVCLFIHGLAETELEWCEQYAEVAREAGFRPAYVRYNSGLAITENGEKLRELLDELTPTRLVLVTHSMGGLIARVAIDGGRGRWHDALTDLVTLGTPHTGAPLERVANAAINVAARFDASEPIARILHRRSRGIKDLGAGLFSTGAGPGPALPEHVHYHAVVASLGPNRNGIKARILGDGLVPIDSAAPPESGANVSRAHLHETSHNALNNHRAIDELLGEILATVRPNAR